MNPLIRGILELLIEHMKLLSDYHLPRPVPPNLNVDKESDDFKWGYVNGLKDAAVAVEKRLEPILAAGTALDVSAEGITS